MQVSCPECGYSKEVNAGCMPIDGAIAGCPKCHHRFLVLPQPTRHAVDRGTSVVADPPADSPAKEGRDQNGSDRSEPKEPKWVHPQSRMWGRCASASADEVSGDLPSSRVEEPETTQLKRSLVLLLITVPFFYFLLLLMGITFWFSSVSLLLFQIFYPFQRVLSSIGFDSERSILVIPAVYGVITAMVFSFFSREMLKKLRKPFAAFVVIGLVSVGVNVYHDLKGALLQTHIFPNSGHPAIEIRNQGFLDPEYVAYIKRPLYRTRIGSIEPRVGIEKCPDVKGEGIVENTLSADISYDIHWSRDGKRIAFSCQGWYVAGFDLDKGTAIEPERGETKIEQFLRK